MPEQVDPDSWLNAIDGKLYQRRVEPNGAVKVDKFRYYVQQKLRGQLVLLKVDAAQQTFEIFFQGLQIKQMEIKGLHHAVLSLQDYLRQICKEAVSEERQRLNHKQHRSTI